MFRTVLVSTLIVVASAAAAQAQTPKVEITGIIGWTLADGVTGDPFKAGNGQTHDPRRRVALGSRRSGVPA